VDEMLKDPQIDIVLNTTTPQDHFEINMKALKAGKHIYCEKPLGLNLEEAQKTLELAKEKGLSIGGAPDVFLGAAVQTCKKVLEDGLIGKIVGAKVSNMYHGPELVHPSPDFLYRKGAGPMLDIGPYVISDLLYFMGPAKELYCYGGIKTPNRPIKDHFVDVEVNTHYNGIIEFESGHSASVNISWETWGVDDGPHVQIYGTEGSLFIYDPDNYGPTSDVRLLVTKDLEDESGAISWKKLSENVEDCKKPVPLIYESPRENRGLGLSEMADSIINGRKNIANGEFACHLVEVLDGFNIAIATKAPYKMQTTFKQQGRIPVDFFEKVSCK
jgi:predicted dehydrogenase